MREDRLTRIARIMNPLLRAAALLTLIACAGCSTDTAKTDHTAPTSPPSHAGGIVLAGMDRSTAPGDDFFTYTNGAWFAKTEIAPDRSTAGTWTVLGDLAQQRTRELVENLAKPGAATLLGVETNLGHASKIATDRRADKTK
jgi:putative endopeptidase